MEQILKNISYDALVIGAGIAGGEAALNLPTLVIRYWWWKKICR